MKLFLKIFSSLIATYLIGFVWFAHSIPKASPEINDVFDGVIVFTGGKGRVQTGIDLLHAGHAKKLLISGVGADTKFKDIIKSSQNFAAHITLGYDAEDTFGNIKEAIEWIKLHKLHKILLVTSDYHMPRSLIQVERALPNLKIIPYAVISEENNIKLILLEYNKYLLTILTI